MKVAAYQAPLNATSSFEVLRLIREQIACCEAEGVAILCCPEGTLGGLADYASSPAEIAINAARGQLQAVLAPLASDHVTTIVGFTELGRGGRLYNSAAVFSKGAIIGIYRKLYPAINQSVYEAGDQLPVFVVDDLTFGILICRDSNYYKPARSLAAQGATALFVPTNNGLPPRKTGSELVEEARHVDIARASENSVFVIRADVAGDRDGLVAYGTSRIVNPAGQVLQAAPQFSPALLVAEINPTT